MDADQSNSVEVGELLQGLAVAFPSVVWDESLSRVMVRSFDTAYPPKGSLNFAEFQTLYQQIVATQTFMQGKAAMRRDMGQIPNANIENWFATGEDILEMLTSFGFPTTADWVETRNNVAISAIGSSGRVRLGGASGKSPCLLQRSPLFFVFP